MSLADEIHEKSVIISQDGNVFKSYSITCISTNLCMEPKFSILCHKIVKIYYNKDVKLKIEQSEFIYTGDIINKDYVIVNKNKIFTLDKKINRIIFLLETLKSKV